jgi:hypothetical protein
LPSQRPGACIAYENAASQERVFGKEKDYRVSFAAKTSSEWLNPGVRRERIGGCNVKGARIEEETKIIGVQSFGQSNVSLPFMRQDVYSQAEGEWLSERGTNESHPMYLEGNSSRSIERLLKVNHKNVAVWAKAYSKRFSKAGIPEKPQAAQ